MNAHEISVARSEQLTVKATPYLNFRKTYCKSNDIKNAPDNMKHRLLDAMHATEADWNDWKWQMAHRIQSVSELSTYLRLSPSEKENIEAVSQQFRWAVTPYYLSLIVPEHSADPIRQNCIPCIEELNLCGKPDPMCEEFTNPIGVITRRYPDRLILNITNTCAVYCRHCQRRRHIGNAEKTASPEQIQESLAYIMQHEEIRDVLITGGDPLTLEDEQIERIVKSIREIPHVEIIRIGTRTPVTLPQRITYGLVYRLKQYHPIYINTQFNHPAEITPDSRKACELLADNGFMLGNQMVLLKNVNNNPFIVQLLNQELLKIRVLPYYIFHAKEVEGTLHFQTSIEEGLQIIAHLRGNTSGLAIPTYIINAPDGLGKVPILPSYITRHTNGTITLRTWEGNTVTITETGNLINR